jgi:hypothetical protein
MDVGISLGWNCESAGKGVELGIRGVKANGYQTCPFDECITNYKGIILCLKEDFKYFCDPMYLAIIPAKFSTGGIVKSEPLIYNVRYGFIFNHESPEHAELYRTQNWSGGKDHYICNDFELFIDRYQRRINNFRNYVKNNSVRFILGKFDKDIDELSVAIKEAYPTTQYNILLYTPSVPIKLFEEHHELMEEKSSHIIE